MKQIYADKIINIPNTPQDERYCFFIPKNPRYSNAIDMRELLLPYKNHSLDYSTDPKLWSEVYSPKKELELFLEITEKALENHQKIHFENLSLAEELEFIEKLYLKLGYFDESLNAFVVDFEHCPITLGVNIRNFAYSFKDYYTLGKEAFFVPPPREPRHQKAIRAGLNSGLISAIHLNPADAEKEQKILETLLLEEKTNLLKL
jgi:dihydroorotase-like cyclic amidohydrolase